MVSSAPKLANMSRAMMRCMVQEVGVGEVE
jgi:hypothetical protein